MAGASADPPASGAGGYCSVSSRTFQLKAKVFLQITEWLKIF